MFVLIACLKDYRRENVDISISDDGSFITVLGKRTVQEMFMSGWIMDRKDIELQTFRKVFRIPDGVVLDKIKAKFDDEEGTMTIFMRKSVKGMRGIGVEEVKEEAISKCIPGEDQTVSDKSIESSFEGLASKVDSKETGLTLVSGGDVPERKSDNERLKESGVESTEVKEGAQVLDREADGSQLELVNLDAELSSEIDHSVGVAHGEDEENIKRKGVTFLTEEERDKVSEQKSDPFQPKPEAVLIPKRTNSEEAEQGTSEKPKIQSQESTGGAKIDEISERIADTTMQTLTEPDYLRKPEDDSHSEKTESSLTNSKRPNESIMEGETETDEEDTKGQTVAKGRQGNDESQEPKVQSQESTEKGAKIDEILGKSEGTTMQMLTEPDYQQKSEEENNPEKTESSFVTSKQPNKSITERKMGTVKADKESQGNSEAEHNSTLETEAGNLHAKTSSGYNSEVGNPKLTKLVAIKNQATQQPESPSPSTGAKQNHSTELNQQLEFEKLGTAEESVSSEDEPQTDTGKEGAESKHQSLNVSHLIMGSAIVSIIVAFVISLRSSKRR